MDATDFQVKIDGLVQIWRARFGSAIDTQLRQALGCCEVMPIDWERWGCHYYSGQAGTWLRKIAHARDTNDKPTMAWETTHCLFKRLWEQTYSVAPKKLNWVSASALARPLVLVIAANKPEKVCCATALDAPLIEWFPSSSAKAVVDLYCTPQNDLLHPEMVMHNDPLDADPSRGDKGEVNLYWADIVKLATDLAYDLGLTDWIRKVPEEMQHSRARSLCYTLLAPLADHVGRGPMRTSLFCVVPWRLEQGDAGSIGLGNFAGVWSVATDSAALDPDSVAKFCETLRASSRDTVCFELLGLEQRMASHGGGSPADTKLEQVIRILAHPGWAQLRDLDVLSEERAVLRKFCRFHKNKEADDDIGLWAVSDSYKRAFEKAGKLGKYYKDKWSNGLADEVRTLFVSSPPGCGKESIWEYLCCVACEGRTADSVPDGQKEKVTAYLNQFGYSGTSPLPLSTIAGRELSQGQMRARLYGDPKGEMPGLLALMHILRHPLFFDEFNTIDRADADALLRLLAQRAHVHDVQLRKGVEIGIPIMFASNRTIEQLVFEDEFNPALYSRFKGGDEYVEIPPLSDRRADVVVAFVSMLLSKFEKFDPRVKLSIDPDALRLVAYVNWDMGNYRALGNFAKMLVGREREAMDRLPKDAGTRRHITVEEMLRCLNEEGALGGNAARGRSILSGRATAIT